MVVAGSRATEDPPRAPLSAVRKAWQWMRPETFILQMLVITAFAGYQAGRSRRWLETELSGSPVMAGPLQAPRSTIRKTLRSMRPGTSTLQIFTTCGFARSRTERSGLWLEMETMG